MFTQHYYLSCYNRVMCISESVILSLPKKMREIQRAANQFAQQYRCVAKVEIRGHVQLESGQQYCILAWHTVAELDYELDLLGLGKPGDEAFFWVAPTGAGELRLSELERENE